MDLLFRQTENGPLYLQVYHSLREAILKGQLISGAPLPSSRELCSHWNLSRNTVLSALDMLKAEGYIESIPSKGLFVASDLPDQYLIPPRKSKPIKSIPISKRGQHLAQHTRPVVSTSLNAFIPGLPDLDAFPIKAWQQCEARQYQRFHHSLMGYREDGGLPELRTAIATYLNNSRGVVCSADQVVVVNGSQAGLDLITRLLISEGEVVGIENPGYLGARDGFIAAGAKCIALPVDEEGLNTQQLEKLLQTRKAKKQSSIKLVYITPSNQFPTGYTLPLSRRVHLLALAKQYSFQIIEDDYDSEFRFNQRPISSLQGLDTENQVIYLGTFSKVMFPGLRLGYLVVPESLAQQCCFALRKTGQDASLPTQGTMALFMENGQFAKHIRRMRKLYSSKQQRLIECAKSIDTWLEVAPNHAGMQLACPFRKSINTDKLIIEAQKKGLVLPLLSRYFFDEKNKRNTATFRNGIYLGYAGIPLDKIPLSVKKLKSVLMASER